MAEEGHFAEIAEVRIATGVEADRVTGLNRSTTSFTMPVLIDRDLEAPGKVNRPPFGDCTIVLRELNDQVLLHEVLHALLDGSVPHDDLDPYGHRTINRVEVTLWEMGWRRAEPTGRWNVRLPDGSMWFRLGVGEEVARQRQAEVPGCTLMRWTRTEETLTEVPLDRPDPKVAAAKERVARRAELRAEAAAEGMELPEDYRENLRRQFAEGQAEAAEIVRRSRRGY